MASCSFSCAPGDLAAAAAHVDELLLVGVLRVVQLGLEVLELAALARGEEYQHVAHLDLLPRRDTSTDCTLREVLVLTS